MSQRLTRKEIKRDEVAEWIGRVTGYLGGHRRAIVLLAVAVVVAAAAAVGAFLWHAGRVEGANELLARAMKVYAAPIEATAPKPDDPDEPSFASEDARRQRARELFTELADSYSLVDVADVAAVYLGRIALTEGETDRARELWSGFVDERPDHVLAGEVRVNLLALRRQGGEAEEVASELQAMLEAPPDDRPLPGDVVLYELGQTYEQLGRTGDAQSTFARLVEEYPQSAYTSTAREKAGPLAQAVASLGS
jgi:tetratricopeptide (TPR) repeat protein